MLGAPAFDRARDLIAVLGIGLVTVCFQISEITWLGNVKAKSKRSSNHGRLEHIKGQSISAKLRQLAKIAQAGLLRSCYFRSMQI